MDAIRLFKVACHLRQQLAARDTDVDRKSKPCANGIADQIRRLTGVAVYALHAAHVQVALIHRHLLYNGGKFPQDLHKARRHLSIQLVIG